MQIPEHRIRSTSLLVWLILFFVLLVHACPSAASQKDEAGEEKVKARPVSAEFMLIVSMCIEETLWQEHDQAATPESSLNSYLGRMRLCLGEWERGERVISPPTVDGQLQEEKP